MLANRSIEGDADDPVLILRVSGGVLLDLPLTAATARCSRAAMATICNLNPKTGNIAMRLGWPPGYHGALYARPSAAGDTESL